MLSEKGITISPDTAINSLGRLENPSGEAGKLHQVTALLKFHLKGEEVTMLNTVVAKNKKVCLPVLMTKFFTKAVGIQPGAELPNT